jgi:hypothetical protein
MSFGRRIWKCASTVSLIAGVLLPSTAFAGRTRSPVNLLATVGDLGTVRAVASDAARDVAAVASSDRGLYVIDLAGVEQGAQPVKTRLAFNGFGRAVATTAGTAYAIEMISGSPAAAKLKVVDIRAPRAPVLMASINLAGTAAAGAVALNGSALYVGATDAGLQVFDIRNPRSPLLLRTVPVYGSIQQIVVNPELRAVFVLSSAGYRVFDVRDPMNPVQLITKSVSGLSIATEGDRLYYTTSFGTLSIVTYTSLSPLVSSIHSHSLTWDGIVAAGGAGLFLSQASEVWTVDRSDTATLNVPRKLLMPGYVRVMTTESDRLLVADSASTLTIYQIH